MRAAGTTVGPAATRQTHEPGGRQAPGPVTTGAQDAPDARHAWLAVAAATVAHAAIIGTVGASSVLVDGIVAAPGGTVGLATVAVVLPAVVLVLLGPVVGRWSDRAGPRPAVLAAIASWVLGQMAAATVLPLGWAVVAAALSLGVAGTCVTTTLVADVAARCRRHRTTALGVIAAGSGLGVMVLGPLLTRVITDHGIRGAWAVGGALGTLALLGTVPALASSPTPAALPSDPVADGATSATRSGSAPSLRLLAHDRPLRRFWGSLLATTAGTMALQSFFVPAMRTTGIDPIRAGTLLGVTGALMVCSRLVVPPLVRSRPYAAYRLAHLALLAAPVAWLLAARSSGSWAGVVTLLGLAGGVRLALLPATAAAARPERLGALLGVLNTAHGLGAVTGPLLAARLAGPLGVHLAAGLVGLVALALANVLLTRLDTA